MKLVQKLLSIALLVIFGLPSASALFAAAPKGETSLPACCRRAGSHHCMQGMVQDQQTATAQPDFRSPRQTCPYGPLSLWTTHSPDRGLAPTAATFAALVSHPAVQAQTESKWRIARERSRSKRGPPALLSL